MTVTLPLYRGEMTNGTSVWYILTDTNDERNAETTPTMAMMTGPRTMNFTDRTDIRHHGL